MEFGQTCLHIDLDAIVRNVRTIRGRAGADILAVVKADAYGLGAVAVSRALEEDCAFFGTANISEALELRRAGIRKPILVLGRMPVSAYPLAVENDVRMPICLYEDALALSAEAVKQGKTAFFHFAVDTGMSRIGFQASEESANLCARIVALPGIQAEGLFSHFATADCADLTRTREQMARFAAFDAMLKARGISIPIRHLSNSAGTMNFTTEYEMVRPGIITYGMMPSDEVDPARMPVEPVFRWDTRVAYLKTLPAGREVSYGGIFTTAGETVVATLPVGYADGYRRIMTGKCHVLIHGRKAPVIGKICMDQIMVDVTGIPDVKLNDTATLIGRDGSEEITADDLARWADTVNYEIVCGLARRLPRIYYQGGKPVGEVHYLLPQN